MEQSLELYTCSATSRDSEMPEYARNGTIPRAYNELATLMSVTGELNSSDFRFEYHCLPAAQRTGEHMPPLITKCTT